MVYEIVKSQSLFNTGPDHFLRETILTISKRNKTKSDAYVRTSIFTVVAINDQQNR